MTLLKIYAISCVQLGRGMVFLESKIMRTAYLGKHAQNLILRTLEQESEIFEMRGIIFPVRASSAVEMIHRRLGISLSEIGRALGFTHQLVAQRIKILTDMSLIEKRPDAKDRRRSGFFLTRTGKAQAKLLRACVEDISQLYKDLFDEIECNLSEKLISAISALEDRPLVQRMEEMGMTQPNLNPIVKLKSGTNG